MFSIFKGRNGRASRAGRSWSKAGGSALLLAGVLGVLALPGVARASFDFPDFDSKTGLLLNGSAGYASPSSLRLTATDPKAWLAGTAWFPAKQHIVDGFSTRFQFRISSPGGQGGGDGFAFVIENSPQGGAAVGGVGGGLGYAAYPGNSDAIPNSLAVEFDTYNNGAALGDVSGNDLAVHHLTSANETTTQANRLGVTTDIPYLKDGNAHTVELTYTPGTLTVFIDDLTTPALSVSVDLAALLALDAGSAYVGFSAASAAAWENHDILSWSFSDDGAGGDLALGSLPSATLGESYVETISVAGGKAPYSFSLKSGSLPDGLSLSSGGELSGTPAAVGTSEFTIEATDSSSPVKSGERTFRLTVAAPFASIGVSVVSAVAEGAVFTVTAMARDAGGNMVADYSGPASWSDLSGALSPAVPAGFVDGVSTTRAKVSAAFRADRVMVSSAGVSGQSGAFDVVGSFAAVEVAVATPVLVGVPFAVTATATDTAGNTVGWYNHAASWSSLDGGLSPSSPSGFVGGVSSTQATVAAAFAGDRVTVSAGGVSGESGLFDVVGPASITVQLVRSVDAGAPLTVRATARDRAGRLLSGFTAPASWSSLDAVLAPASPAGFVDGVSTTIATVAAPFHADRVTVTAGGAAGQSTPFNVLGPLVAYTFSLSGASTPAGSRLPVIPAGQGFGLRVQAYDAAGNFLDDYQGAASWSSLDGGLSPAIPSRFVNGVSRTRASVPAIFRDDRILFTGGGVDGQTKLFHIAGPAARIRVRVVTPIRHGQPFQVKAVSFDRLGTPVVNYTASAAWSSLDGRLAPAAPSAFVNGVSTTTATIPTVFTNDRITVSSAGVSGQSGVFDVH